MSSSHVTLSPVNMVKCREIGIGSNDNFTTSSSSILQRQEGKRKSAVELLAESKSHYVKSEKVLDGKQELKNQDHLHVRSPTIDVSSGTIISGTSTTPTSTMLRSPAPPIINGGGPFPFAMCLTCPPYPHQHFEHFDHYQNNQHHHHHNHHLSQGSLHLNQQQHHLNAPLGGSSVVVDRSSGGGNSSGPPSVESGGTASTGSTGGGGGVSAITTLGRSSSGKHHNHQHHHYHHSTNSHHSKQQRSSSTGSSGGSRGHQTILQENLIIEPLTLLSTSSTSLKTNTIGRHSSSKNRQIQPPGTLSIISKREFQNQLKRDSGNVLASLLPGMSFTLPAQSSQHHHQHSHLHSHQHHHHLHHYHHHHHSSSKNNASHHTHPQLLLQQKALASVASSTPKPSYSSTTSVATAANAPSSLTTTSTCAPINSTAANGLSGGVRTTIATTNSTSASAQHRDVKTSNHGIAVHARHHQNRHHFKSSDDDDFDNDEDESDSPPPLPPKSPRITNTATKPARPHDFPQQLQLSVVDPSIESSTKKQSLPQDVPPPPPRRHSSSNSSSSHHPSLPPPIPPQKESKYLRLLQDQPSNKLPHSIISTTDPTTQSMTLPSPILPPTPPPDVVMESPMSDSGPIISPPPAFSTPVTPMIDRQNSATSDKTGGGLSSSILPSSTTTTTTTTPHLPSTATGTRLRSLSQSTSHYHNITGFSLVGTTSGLTGSTTLPKSPHQSHNSSSHHQPSSSSNYHIYHTPLSGTVSMSAISAVSSRGGATSTSNITSSVASRNIKSIPDLSSARYSPMSRSRSNSSPMSPNLVEASMNVGTSSPEEEDDDDDEEEDDEDADEDPTSSSLADNGHDGDDDCSDRDKGARSSGQGQHVGHLTPQQRSPKKLSLPLSITTPSPSSGLLARRNSAKVYSTLTSQQTVSSSSQVSKVTLIPKSVTDNFLYKVGNSAQTTGATVDKVNQIVDVSVTQKPKSAPVEAPSPPRRPILRSKSDLSHRYAKVTAAANPTTTAEKPPSGATPHHNVHGGRGFTLVQVDIGGGGGTSGGGGGGSSGLPPPPPIPMHTNTQNFTSTTKMTTSSGGGTALNSSVFLPGSSGTLPANFQSKSHNHHTSHHPSQQHHHASNHYIHLSQHPQQQQPKYHGYHHHHVYQTPNNSNMIGATSSVSATQLTSMASTGNHYHEPFHGTSTGGGQGQATTQDGKRATKSASDLERFFDMLGLDSSATTASTSAPHALNEISKDAVDSGAGTGAVMSGAGAGGRRKSGSESPVFFSSVSSVDSAPRRSGGSVDSEDSPLEDKLGGSRTVGGYKLGAGGGGGTIMVQHGEPSIVERNARVIKWLFNCRKAMERR